MGYYELKHNSYLKMYNIHLIESIPSPVKKQEKILLLCSNKLL